MYTLARAIAQCIVATFFSEVQVVGLERIPVQGPVIFVSNHNNKFVDASVIMACIPRNLRFLIATVSLKVRVVGRLAKFAGAIGVNRPQDMKYVGMGRVIDVALVEPEHPLPEPAGDAGGAPLADSAAPPVLYYTLKGNKNTRFRIDCKKHDRIGVNGLQYVIDSVLDDHTLRTSRKLDDSLSPPDSPAHSKLLPASSTPTTKSPVTAGEVRTLLKETIAYPFTVYPKVDQGDVYECVSRALYEGSSICIFPEGGSHDQPGLLPLKPGVAVMALNSALLGVEDVLIVPVGIHYFDRDKFGSKAVVEIGTPLAISEDLVEKYSAGCKNEAVNLLMTQVKERLEDCLIYATSCDLLNVIKLCASLYPPDRMVIGVEKFHRLQAVFTQLINRYGDDFKELEESVLEYGRLLQANGLRDCDVTSIMQLNAELAALMLVYKLVPTVLISAVVLPAVAITYPLKWLSVFMTERHRSEALAKSNVKLTAVDVIASYKIVWCICILPILFVLCGAVVATAYPVNVPSSKRYFWVGWAMTFLAAIVVQPVLTYWGLRLQSRLPLYLKQVRCYYRVLFSELDVWRGGEREVMIDRIHLQLAVREFIKALARKDDDTERSGKSKLRDVINELENLIPTVIIDTDTRRPSFSLQTSSCPSSTDLRS